MSDRNDRNAIIANPKTWHVTDILEKSDERYIERLCDDYDLDTHAHVEKCIKALETLTRGVRKSVDPVSYTDELLRPAGDELFRIGGERLIHAIVFVLTTLFGKRLIKFPKLKYTQPVEDCLKKVWDGLGFDCLA